MSTANFPKLYCSFLTGPSHCRSWSLCEALVSKKIVFFQSHHPCCDKSAKWHDEPFHQTNCLCPFGALEIFFPHLQLPQIPSCYTHTCKFPHQSCSQFPLFPYSSAAFPHFHPPSFSLGTPFFSLPARSTLSPSFSTYLCVCACGTRTLVVIFQAAAQKIGLS